MNVKENVEDIDLVDEHFIEDDEDTLQDNKYLTFKISDETYGVDIGDITEIIELQKITGIPDMPDHVKGVINLRGKVIPVIDLRLRFHLEDWKYDDRTCIVIAKVNETSVGFIVDRVLEVLDIPEANIDPPPQFKSKSGYEKYVMGIGKVGKDVKILIDVQKVVHSEDMDRIKEIKQNY